MSKQLEIPEYYKNYLAKEDETLYEHTAELLECLGELSKFSDIKNLWLVELSCLYHDVGKINALFQNRLNAHKKFDATKEVGHNILSAILAKALLQDVDKEQMRKVIYAILNHHHYVDNFGELEDKQLLIKENLETISCTILPQSSRDKDLSKSIGGREANALKKLEEDIDSQLIKGFLHKCDYSASAHEVIEIPNVDLDQRMERYWDRKEYIPNDMQKFARDNRDRHLILIGSTGLGKTEASLMWLGNQKGFYVLPLRSAINAMYERVKRDFYPMDYSSHLGLLHSEARSVYFKNLEERVQKVGEKEQQEFWNYYGTTKSMALPVTITTPDQIFRFAFKYPAYELMLATCSYSKIIIDEIQAYSPDILATLIYSLQWIDKVGGKFILTTATLPPFIKSWLEKYMGKSIVEKEFLKEEIRHHVQLCDREIVTEDIFEFIDVNRGRESLKILVVVNTVRTAQRIYKELRENIEDDIVVKVLHSRFTVQDRNLKEEEILNDGATACKKKVIWVATQVVEASLDIDFDVLFTELSDLSGLFQRLGRCNRKGKKSIDAENVFVYTVIPRALYRKSSEKNSYTKKGLIFESLFELSKTALYNWSDGRIDGMMSEKDKNRMISTYFTLDKLKEYEERYPDSSYIREFEDAYRGLESLRTGQLTLDEATKSFRNITSISVIPTKIYLEKSEEFAKIRDDMEMIIQDKQNREENKFKMLQLQNQLNQYTLTVDMSYKMYIQFQSPLQFGYEKFYLINASYDQDIGLLRENEESGLLQW